MTDHANTTTTGNPPATTSTGPINPPQARPAGHPLGPIIWRHRAHHPASARAAALAVFLASAAVLALAAWLKPDPRGVGTHEQLGLAPCSMTITMGYPCPSCGMTTAFACTVRGRFIAAFHAHPGGLALALATATIAAAALSVTLTGRVVRVNWYRVSPGWFVVTIAAVILGGWAYKIATGLATGTLPYQ